MSDTNITTKHVDAYSSERFMRRMHEATAHETHIKMALADLADQLERHPEDAFRLREAIIACLEITRPALESLNIVNYELIYWETSRSMAHTRDLLEGGK